MRLLRGALYAHALAWIVLGALLAIWPGVLQSWLGQPPYVDRAWVRLVGVQAVGLALFMVLVGHRLEELWWWSWGFVLTTGAVAAVLTLNAAFGLPQGADAVLWWVLAIGHWALGSATLVGMSRAARERPTDRYAPAPARDPHPRGRRR
ncbi:MAG TPA: hypothetical protein VF097_06590 [Actinomycetota bacterium]